MTASPCIIGGTGPRLFGLCLLGVSGFLLFVGTSLDWGVAWTTWAPAVGLIPPGLGLLRKHTFLNPEPGIITTRHGTIDLSQCRCSIVPMAGFRAVVLLRDDGSYSLASWLLPRTAERLANWLNDANGKPMEHVVAEAPRGDV